MAGADSLIKPTRAGQLPTLAPTLGSMLLSRSTRWTRDIGANAGLQPTCGAGFTTCPSGASIRGMLFTKDGLKYYNYQCNTVSFTKNFIKKGREPISCTWLDLKKKRELRLNERNKSKEIKRKNQSVEKMTVLSEENAVGESSSAPPRKRVCLSLSGRGNKLVRGVHNELTHVRRGLYDRHHLVTDQLRFTEEYQDLSFSSPSSRRPCNLNTKDKNLLNPLEGDVMMNGYLTGDSHKSSTDDSPGSDVGAGGSPIAPLCNLGNTCFLNSVIYTLRFAPMFVHNLHHLVVDLAEVNNKNQLIKIKSSSLGRNISSSSSKSWSTKDLLSIGSGLGDLHGKSRIQMATERLHELYESLHSSELKDTSEPFQPDVFLHALRDVNPIFEGNQQHDAHELLVCLLDNIRETCRLLASQVQASQILSESINGLADFDSQSHYSSNPTSSTSLASSSGNSTGSKLSWAMRKSWKSKKGNGGGSSSSAGGKNNGLMSNGSIVRSKETEHLHAMLNGGQHLSGISEVGLPSNPVGVESCKSDAAATGVGTDAERTGGSRKRVGYNFVSADFEGVTVLRTTCLECEHVTERKETFCDICVPITTDTAASCDDVHSTEIRTLISPSSVVELNTTSALANYATEAAGENPQRVSEQYQAAIVTSEHLRDGNKYWCEQCLRYNEARRSVRYERLPRLLVLQLKRFSSTFGSMVCMSKVNDYMPTPLRLACFCDQCCHLPEDERLHYYDLYGVIMHLGATIASGHYVAYVKASDNKPDYLHCDRDKRKALSLSSSSAGAGNKPSSNERTSGDKMGGLFKFLSRPKSSAGQLDAAAKLSTANAYLRYTCRSMDCCGVKLNNSVLDLHANGGATEPSNQHYHSYGNTRDSYAPPPTSVKINGTADDVSSSTRESIWMECDDETVRLLTKKEFEDVLAPKPSKVSALTPYLLHRSRGWAFPERWVYTISWNSDDEEQAMLRVEGYKEGVPATRVSRWAVGSSPGGNGWVTTQLALEFTLLYTLRCCLALFNERKGSFPLARENAEGRVVGAAGASAEERYKGRLKSEAQQDYNRTIS
uniref:USP domain-containing protein n=1 Tax=Timema douglasi TaxID=61478 RepID=A0A7R8Z720_TIMDO|nr:unnamed protein product [Timema douglasi]